MPSTPRVVACARGGLGVLLKLGDLEGQDSGSRAKEAEYWVLSSRNTSVAFVFMIVSDTFGFVYGLALQVHQEEAARTQYSVHGWF